MKREIKIGKRGSDLAFRIPKALVDKYNLKVGDPINMDVFERELVASRAKSEIQQT